MKDIVEIKQKLYHKCTEYIDQRIESIQKKLDDVIESRGNETKSSAGDKHETGRTMMQLEEQKAMVQLHAALDVKQVLHKIDITTTQSEAGLGSLVICSSGSYFIAISAGKIKLEKKEYYAISIKAPIAQILLGKRKDDSLKFNNKEIKVHDVL